MGLCPFHNEKTASFSVDLEAGLYYCFGCHKGGSVITFIREIEGLDFQDTVRFLAKRAGMELPEEDAREAVREAFAKMAPNGGWIFSGGVYTLDRTDPKVQQVNGWIVDEAQKLSTEVYK